MSEQIKPVAISQKEIDLAHEGMELHETDAPEYIISAALLRACETVQQLQDELANSEYAATAEANAGDRARQQVKQLQREKDNLASALEMHDRIENETNAENEKLRAELAAAKQRIAEAENPHVKIAAKPDGVWIYFDVGNGQKAMLNLSTVLPERQNGITMAIIKNAIAKAIDAARTAQAGCCVPVGADCGGGIKK